MNARTDNVSDAQYAFIQSCRKQKRIIRLTQWTIFILFFGLWELAAYTNAIDAFIFSSPSRMFITMLSLASDGSLFYHMGMTIFETMVSFITIMVLGLLFATFLWWNNTAARIADPYLVVLNSLPKSALAPLFIIWLGSNLKTIITAAASVAIFGTIMTLYSGFISTEEDKVKLILTLGGKKKDVLTRVVLPYNLPVILNSMKVNIGLSLVGVIIAEFIVSKAGLGYLIIYGTQVYKLDWVILSIVLLCIIATGLYKLLSLVEHKILSKGYNTKKNLRSN